MNPSILLSPNPVAVQRVEKDLSKYTSYRIVRLFGHNLLQTSYFFKPSYIAESLSDSSSLSPEGAAKRDFFLKQNPTGKLTETEWGEIADADGLPKEIPVSVWGARTLKKQRAILNDAVWNDKLFNNVNAVLVSMEITRPGIYTPPLFEGPPGASKTYSILIASALLGRPAMVVVGDPSLSGTVQRDLLRGGDGASVNNRPRMLADQAYHGVFNQPAARAQYYREIQKVIKSGGAPDFFTAHDVLSQNNEQNNSIWNRIGDIEGIGGEGSIAAKKYGKAEIGRLNGAMIVFDEVNVINPVYHTVLEEFLSSKEDQNPINCEFSMTANPPTEENVNRSHLTYPLLNRCRRKTIEPLTGSEYGQMIATQLGISQPYQIQSGGKTISIYDELTRVLKEDGVSDEEVQTLLPAAQGKSFISSFLTEDSVRKIASRLGGFHAEIEEKARKGGDLHSSSYGLEQMPDTVSYRQLQSTLLMWDSFAYNMALEKTGSVDSLNKEILVESLVKALDENYVQVFAYTNSSGDSQFARGGVAAINSSGLVKDLLSSNQLTAEHISSDLTVVNKNEMNKNVEKLASDVLGRPATKNEIRKLGGLLSEIVGDSAIPSLQFNKEKNAILRSHVVPSSNSEAVPSDVSEVVAGNEIQPLVVSMIKNNSITTTGAVVFFTETPPKIAFMTSDGVKTGVAVQEISPELLKEKHKNGGVFSARGRSYTLSYFVRETVISNPSGIGFLSGSTPTTPSPFVEPKQEIVPVSKVKNLPKNTEPANETPKNQRANTKASDPDLFAGTKS